MVTYYNRKDLVSFGRYLLSEKRKALFQESYEEAVKNGLSPVPPEESLRDVHHSDIENWVLDEPRNTTRQPHKTYYASVDPAMLTDDTVVTIMGSDNKVHAVHKVNGKDWRVIATEVAAILKEYNPRQTLVESNGTGSFFIEILKPMYSNIEPWKTCISTRNIIEELKHRCSLSK